MSVPGNRWHTLKDKKVFETPVFDLHMKKSAPTEGGRVGEFYVLNAPDWINVIAKTPDERFLLVEQYRHGIENYTLEIPGGMVDPDEEPLQAAKRELKEETGFMAGSWRSLGKVCSNPAIQNNFTYLFLAEDCRKVSEQDTGRFEQIKTHLVQQDLFLEYIRDGTVDHAIVLSAVAKYLLDSG